VKPKFGGEKMGRVRSN